MEEKNLEKLLYLYYDYLDLITKFWPGSTKWNCLGQKEEADMILFPIV